MLVERLAIPDVLLLTPKRSRDERGFFSETYNRRTLFEATGLELEFVQDNHSLSKDVGVLRGLHFQIPPHAQDKLVRVTAGSIYDVAVDVRPGSATFGQVVGATLDDQEGKQILVPKGFAHGFITLQPDTEVMYKVTDFYVPECDEGIAWNDPKLGIGWPRQPEVLSGKDKTHPTLAEALASGILEGFRVAG